MSAFALLVQCVFHKYESIDISTWEFLKDVLFGVMQCYANIFLSLSPKTINSYLISMLKMLNQWDRDGVWAWAWACVCVCLILATSDSLFTTSWSVYMCVCCVSGFLCQPSCHTLCVSPRLQLCVCHLCFPTWNLSDVQYMHTERECTFDLCRSLLLLLSLCHIQSHSGINSSSCATN